MCATSPDEVIEASGTGKGQFYHYFKSKDWLVREVLQFYAAAIRSGAAPVNYDIQSWEDLEPWFSAQVELQRRFRMTRVCPFGTIGSEVSENDELIRQDLSLIFELVGNQLAAFFIKEKAKGRISEAINEKQLADFCVAVAQGAMLSERSKEIASWSKQLLARLSRTSRPMPSKRTQSQEPHVCRHHRNLQAESFAHSQRQVTSIGDRTRT